MRTHELNVQILPPQYVIKGFVHGDEETCNYEKYLTELINYCPKFMLNFEAPFEQIKIQSNGEPDARSNNYGLDYKLAASQTKLQSSSILSSQIWRMEDGYSVYGSPKQEDGVIVSTRLFAALRGKTIDDLKCILGKADRNQVEKDIVVFLKNLETKKNLLLFIPYKYLHIPQYKEIEDGYDEIIESIKRDYCASLKYRKEVADGFDTFIATTYEDRFLLAVAEDDDIVLLDSIELSLSPTFEKLSFYDIW